jgi:hypothetical protein
MSTKRAKFVQDAKLYPDRYYRNPSDIIRDRRLNRDERLEIVTAWENETRQLIASAVASDGADEKLDQLRRLRAELELENANGSIPKRG